jgi:hypothetical protein
MKAIRSLLITLIVALLVFGSIVYVNNKSKVSGATLFVPETDSTEKDIIQQEIIDELMLNLKEQGVPIKSIEIVSDDRWAPPVVIDCVLQSSTESGKTSPEDPIYHMLVERAVNLAQTQGLIVGATGITFVDSDGNVFSWIISAVKEIENINLEFKQGEVGNDTVATLIRQDLSLNGMILDNLEVVSDNNNFRWVKLDISVPDIEIANVGIKSFMDNFKAILTNLITKENAEVAVSQIRLTTTQGHPLLTYVDDLQMRTTFWWQTDGLIEDWLPYPAPIEINN